MESDDFRKSKKKVDNFIGYSGLAFEMVVIIGAGTFLGVKIDQWIGLKFPIFTLVLITLSVIGAIYHAIRKFL
jgi:predicted ABC-type exoprotein transport system permease subunit